MMMMFIFVAGSLGVTKFWESFGYVSQNWKDPPSEDIKFVRKRAMQTPTLVQCGKLSSLKLCYPSVLPFTYLPFTV